MVHIQGTPNLGEGSEVQQLHPSMSRLDLFSLDSGRAEDMERVVNLFCDCLVFAKWLVVLSLSSAHMVRALIVLYSTILPVQLDYARERAPFSSARILLQLDYVTG